jgi:hypothetical protein
VAVAAIALLGAHDALHHGVHRFEVAGIRAQRQVHGGGTVRAQVVRVAEVVLHITVALDVGRQRRAFELGKDHLVRLAQDVSEDIDAAAMRHTHHHFGDVTPCRLLHERVEQGNQRLAAFERKPLLSRVPRVEELLERLRRDQAIEDAHPVVRGQPGTVPARLHPLLQPVPPPLVRDGEVLDAERPAIGLFECRHQVAQRPALAAAELLPPHHGVEIALREAELFQAEKGVRARAVAERIEIGDDVAELAIGVHEIGDGQASVRARSGTGGGARKLVAREDERPPLVDRVRIAPVVRVETIHVLRICAGDVVQQPHDPFTVPRGNALGPDAAPAVTAPPRTPVRA